MEYPPAFRLQDKTTGKHDLRHMTKHEQFFLSVSDTVIRVQLRTDSIQFFIRFSIFYLIKSSLGSEFDAGRLQCYFLTAREKRDSNEARVCYCLLCVPESQTCGTLSGAKDFARFISLK